MRKEISPDLYNYNKFPGPVFHRVQDRVLADNLSFVLVQDVKEAFDPEVFGQRFSAVLTKYDYIVGDWSNEQLRLRGFYKDHKTEQSLEKISRLEDYLLEYCSFGCAYFVLENEEPKRASFDKKNRKKEEEATPVGEKRFSQQKRKNSAHKKPKQGKRDHKNQEETSKRHFVIRQK